MLSIAQNINRKNNLGALSVIGIIVLILFMGCADIRLIGAYDKTTDETIQKVSKDISTLLIHIEKNFLDNKTADNEYDKFRDEYINIEGDIEALKIRTGALPKYEMVKTQVSLLQDNLKLLEELHKSHFVIPGKNAIGLLENTKVIFETAFTAMLTLQNNLRRDKAN